jgi:hypothetical protein
MIERVKFSAPQSGIISGEVAALGRTNRRPPPRNAEGILRSLLCPVMGKKKGKRSVLMGKLLERPQGPRNLLDLHSERPCSEDSMAKSGCPAKRQEQLGI